MKELRIALLFGVAIAALVLSPGPAAIGADNAPPAPRSDYWRKFPWSPNGVHHVTNGYCGDPANEGHCGAYHAFALDFDLARNESLFVATESQVERVTCDGYCEANQCTTTGSYLGNYVVAKWPVSSPTNWVTYGHLNYFYGGLQVGQTLAQGDYLGQAGDTGTTNDGYGHCFYHLHYNEQSGYFGGNSIKPEPFDGQYSMHTGVSYTSHNVWIGFQPYLGNCGDLHREYWYQGHWPSKDATGVMGPLYNRQYGLPPYQRGVACAQDVDNGDRGYISDGAHIFQGTTRAFTVRATIWLPYRDRGDAGGWLSYPTIEEYDYTNVWNGVTWRRQDFLNGYICTRLSGGTLSVLARQWGQDPNDDCR